MAMRRLPPSTSREHRRRVYTESVNCRRTRRTCLWFACKAGANARDQKCVGDCENGRSLAGRDPEYGQKLVSWRMGELGNGPNGRTGELANG